MLIVHMKGSGQNAINPFLLLRKTFVFHPQSVYGNLYVMLEYLKDPTSKQLILEYFNNSTSKQMVAEIL